jgi:hypothetical protein
LVAMRWLLADVMPARQSAPAASQLSKEVPSPTGH